jgi:hypothetical protein
MNFVGKGFIAKPPNVYDNNGWKCLRFNIGFKHYVGGKKVDASGRPDNVITTWILSEVFGRLADLIEAQVVKGATIAVTQSYFYLTQPKTKGEFGHLVLRISEAVILPPKTQDNQPPIPEPDSAPRKPAARQPTTTQRRAPATPKTPEPEPEEPPVNAPTSEEMPEGPDDQGEQLPPDDPDVPF